MSLTSLQKVEPSWWEEKTHEHTQKLFDNCWLMANDTYQPHYSPISHTALLNTALLSYFLVFSGTSPQHYSRHHRAFMVERHKKQTQTHTKVVWWLLIHGEWALSATLSEKDSNLDLPHCSLTNIVKV